MAEAIGTAQFSDDGVYRYWLTRTWANGPKVAWCLLNPSTATADEDDNTIRRCIGYSKEWGYAGLVIVNLFGLRSTDPKLLLKHDDPDGPENHYYQRGAARSYPLVLGWGANAEKFSDHYERVLALMQRGQHSPPTCLGQTKGGHPKHPLYLDKTLERRPFVLMGIGT